MVQAIENWTDLSGTVREVRPHEAIDHMADVVLEVEEANDVEGFPNLLSDTPGRELAVAVEKEAVRRSELRAGARVRCRAQRAGPRTVVAHPRGLSPG